MKKVLLIIGREDFSNKFLKEIIDKNTNSYSIIYLISKKFKSEDLINFLKETNDYEAEIINIISSKEMNENSEELKKLKEDLYKRYITFSTTEIRINNNWKGVNKNVYNSKTTQDLLGGWSIRR